MLSKYDWQFTNGKKLVSTSTFLILCHPRWVSLKIHSNLKLFNCAHIYTLLNISSHTQHLTESPLNTMKGFLPSSWPLGGDFSKQQSHGYAWHDQDCCHLQRSGLEGHSTWYRGASRGGSSNQPSRHCILFLNFQLVLRTLLSWELQALTAPLLVFFSRSGIVCFTYSL